MINLDMFVYPLIDLERNVAIRKNDLSIFPSSSPLTGQVEEEIFFQVASHGVPACAVARKSLPWPGRKWLVGLVWFSR